MKLAQITQDDGNPYADLIRMFFLKTFPTTEITKSDLLEALTSAFVASNQVRYGPAPSPEVLVNIRKVIRKAIDVHEPVPILVPWGGRKANLHSGIDVAEVMGLKTLEALHQRVRQFYTPGIKVNIRLEDTGALYLFQDDGAAGRVSTVSYTEQFQMLVKALGLDFIDPIAESTLMDEKIYFEASEKIRPLLYSYLTVSEQYPEGDWKMLPQYETLLFAGWAGHIPREQRDFYIHQYEKLYPQASHAEHLNKLAMYLAGALARYKLGGSAAPSKAHMKISFVQPVPGAPEGLTSTTLYYRTIPANLARTHIPPWRAKGYLRIDSSNEVVPKITSWADPVVSELTQCFATIALEDESATSVSFPATKVVKVRTDYIAV